MTLTVRQHLDRAGVVILDGALGTELERRGFTAPLPLWTGDAVARAPDLLYAVHRDHLRAGADIVTANTFRTAPYSLRKVGREGDAAILTRDSVGVARAACAAAGHGFVAGSMAPLEDCFHPERVPATDILRREHEAHAGHLVAAGVDLILIETMGTGREAVAAALAALATGLPVLVSVIAAAANGAELLSGETLDTALGPLRVLDLQGHRVDGFLVNCTPPQTTLSTLEHMGGDPRPIGASPNAGRWTPRGDWDARGVAPDAFAIWGQEAQSRGARLLGGCCGTTPEHIAALAAAVRRRPDRPI